MPNNDRTGPQGKGSATGRGLGYCNGNRRNGYGRGNGFRCNTLISLTKEEEKNILESELSQIEIQKKAIETKLQELNQVN